MKQVAQEAATPIFQKTRRADKKLHNKSAEDFIPVACHYNENTLLTKNGELVQIIRVNGINAEHISEKLLDLREILNNAIKNNAPRDGSIAFWIHTIRRKENLDDQTLYSKLFSANLHNIWKNKNYWDDKFVNTLYISLVHISQKVNLNDATSIIRAISYNKYTTQVNTFLDNSFLKLNDVTNKILKDLEDLGANQLGITYEDGQCFSDMIFLYHRIVRLNEDKCLVPINDLGKYIATDRYAIGGDKIEVEEDDQKKFTAILSLKEYRALSANALDKFLQLPIELIATEIFYFINQNYVKPFFKEQTRFLKISGDEKLMSAKGLDEINSNDNNTIFCNQQISISLISDNIENLEQKISQASGNLSEIGILHVREDINLEQTFWAQLPGNFIFLRRLNHTTINNATALASLHNFPTGSQYNIWGKSVTLLRTERGTPYFMNFHDLENKGNTGIFGGKDSGKTVLMNFLISESTKYNPYILHISPNANSEIFIHALEGKWIDAEDSILNPFLLENNKDNVSFIYEFLKIICNHYIIELAVEDLKFLQELAKYILELPEEKRIFSDIIGSPQSLKNISENLQARLEVFRQNGKYHGIFDNNNADFINKDVIGINLYKFSDEYYSLQNLPDESKLMDKFNQDLLLHSSVRTGIIYSIFYQYNKITNNNVPKIIALDEVLALLDIAYFANLINEIYYNYSNNNGVVIANFSIEALLKQEADITLPWFNIINTTIILPNDATQSNLREKLHMTQLEIEKISNISNISRLFLVKQSGSSILVELSIGAMIGFLKILSSNEEDRETFRTIYEENNGNIEQWLSLVYQTLEKK